VSLHLVVGVRGDEHGRDAQTACPQLVSHLETGNSRHRQIQNQASDDAQFTRLEKLLPGCKSANAKCKRSQETSKTSSERLVIVDNGNDWNLSHGLGPSQASPDAVCFGAISCVK
jgi:hypothetical protein